MDAFDDTPIKQIRRDRVKTPSNLPAVVATKKVLTAKQTTTKPAKAPEKALAPVAVKEEAEVVAETAVATVDESTPKNPKRKKKVVVSDDDDEVVQLASLTPTVSVKDEEDQDEEKKKKKSAPKKTPSKKKKEESSESESSSSSESDDEEDEDFQSGSDSGSESKKGGRNSKSPEKKKRAPKKTPSKKKKKEDDDEEEEERSDEESSASEAEAVGAKKGEVRWKTLKHNGPLFPAPYVPHGVPLEYDGEEVKLPAEVEEAASFYAKYIDSAHAQKKQFNENFWRDFRELVKRVDRVLAKKLKDFEKCSFRRIADHLKADSERKKTKTKNERQREKDEKEAQRKKYGIAIVDGKEQRIGNFTIEPPGLFLGRGDHPKTGMIKRRVQPEDVTLNLGEGESVPPCPVPGHRWGAVVHNNRTTWLANWHENVNEQNKYVWLHASSAIKGSADRLKYETARKLKEKIGDIRESYTRDLKSTDRLERQRATALYLIDKLALRVGGEKGEDEADTVGCCSLRVEHISFPEEDEGEGDDEKKRKKRPLVAFDFLGKDSMRYKNTVEVTDAVYHNMKQFASKGASGKSKKPDENLFDLLATTELNDYLKKFMKHLSAKVFRTYNASFTLQQELAKQPEGFSDMTADQKVLFYNRCNKQVAILCNHQRSISQGTYSATIGGFKELLLELVKQRKALKEEIVRLGGKAKGIKKTRVTPAKKKKKTTKKARKKDGDSDSEFEKSKLAPDSGSDDEPKAAAGTAEKTKEQAADEIDEEAINSDDPDVDSYRKQKAERERVKAEREKRIKEREEAEAEAEKKKKEEEASESPVKMEVDGEGDDEKKLKPSKAKKAKKESGSDSDGESEKEKGKKKAKKKAKKAKKGEEEEDDDDAQKEKAGFVLPSTLEGCQKRLAQVEAKIDKTKIKMVEKGELRNVALSTSKINYMDPRITVAWCKRAGVPLEKVFQKSLRDKFTWALEVEPDFKW